MLNTRVAQWPALAKTVRVHDDTHRALKRLKESKRSASLDEVIREMVKATTGVPVGRGETRRDTQLTAYSKG